MTRYAVKALGDGKIEAYGVRWGSPMEPDRSEMKDFFTPQTDLMLEAWGWPRPILLEHMMTPEGEAAGSVGSWTGAARDTTGVKMAGQLNTGHPLYPQLDRDIRAGKYYLSSDSAHHLIKRQRMPNGTNKLLRWGLLTASLTTSPAEQKLLPASFVKALALKQGARHSAGDQLMLQGIYDSATGICELAEQLGADPGMMDEPESDTEASGEMMALDAAKMRLELDLLELELSI